jgi:hypothetical protein
MQATATSQFVHWDGAPPTTPVTCADLSFGTDPRFFSGDSREADPKGGDLVLWSSDAPIAADANSKPVGSLDIDGAVLHVLERRGARTQLRVESPSETVVGWVPSSEVMTAAQAKKRREEEERRAAKGPNVLLLMNGYNEGPLRSLNGGPAITGASPDNVLAGEGVAAADAGAKPSESNVEGLICPASVRLMAELDGRRTWIGTLDPGVSVIVVSREGPVVRVRLAHSVAAGFRAPRNQVLEVPARDLASCTAGTVKDD